MWKLEGENAESTIHVQAPLSSEGGDRGGSPIESMYFDEIFLAPQAEGMQNFLRRIRSTALCDRPWLVPDQVIDLVTDRPVSGSSKDLCGEGRSGSSSNHGSSSWRLAGGRARSGSERG